MEPIPREGLAAQLWAVTSRQPPDVISLSLTQDLLPSRAGPSQGDHI